MPFNKDGTFTRQWRFLDRFASGDDITRADMDIAIDDVVDAFKYILSLGQVEINLPEARSDIQHVFDFNPARNGVTSDVAKFQAAIDSRQNTAGPHVIVIPQGQYAGDYSTLEYGNRTVYWYHEGTVSFVGTAPTGQLSEIFTTALKEKLEGIDSALIAAAEGYASSASVSAAAAIAAAAVAEGNAALRKRGTILAADLTNPIILPFAPSDISNVDIFVDGLDQSDNLDFTLSGDELTCVGGWPVTTKRVNWKILGGFATLDQSGLAAHETLDDFEQWESSLPAPVPDGAMAFVGGKAVVKDASAGGLGAYINNWKAPDGIVTTNHIGTSSAIATDFKGVAEEMIDVAMNKGYVAYFETPPDGSPFEYTYFRPTISGKVLRVRGDKNAEFYPVNNFQTFDTNGVQTVFVHSSILWDWEGPSEGYGAEFIYIDPDDLETKRVKLTIGVDIDVALNGSVYEWTVYLPVSVQETLDGYDPEDPRIPLLDAGTLKIVSARGAFAVNAATGSGAELHWDGFFRLNVSRGGIAISSGGRSGFGHVGVDHIYHSGFIHTYGSPTSGPDAAFIDQRGDGNYVPLGFLTMQGNGTVIGDYLCDVGGIYASGDGTTTGETGDPIYCQLPNIVARNCALVLKDTRKIQSGFAPSVIGLDCKNFYVNAPQDGFQQGENFTMGYGRAVRTQRRVLDIRNNTGLIRINDLSIEDFGMETDGETPADGAHGIFLSGAKGVSCNFRATRRRWDAPSAALVTFEGDETQGNRIHGVARGYDNLVSNSVNDTLAAGNEVDIRHDGATTLYDATGAGIDNIRRKFTNILTDEVVEKSVFPVINTSPAFFIAGAVNSPTITMSTDPDPTLSDTVIEKRLDGDMMWFNLTAQGSVTHTETARAFRILLDFSADNSAGNQIPLTVGRITGITPPSNTANLHAYIGDETNHIEFLWKIQGTGQTLLTTDHIASGATPVIQVSGIVPIAG